jgi:hypothetical protein
MPKVDPDELIDRMTDRLREIQTGGPEKKMYHAMRTLSMLFNGDESLVLLMIDPNREEVFITSNRRETVAESIILRYAKIILDEREGKDVDTVKATR